MYDLIVIGGGPAGTAAAITAARVGANVLLLERGRFPRHKVCGEFVSAESLSVLAELLSGDHTSLLADSLHIPRARVFIDGQVLEAPVDPPAVSIARIDLDAALWHAAELAGVELRRPASGVRPRKCLYDGPRRHRQQSKRRVHAASGSAPTQRRMGTAHRSSQHFAAYLP